MEIYKSTSPRRGSPIKSVAGADGHNYYLLNGASGRAAAAVYYVPYYSSLEHYEPVEYGDEYPGGFYWVRDAASTGADHYGDPTVHAGWAMYIWDPDKYQVGVMHSGWVKVAEQGDVDWDIGDELKAQFVLKTVYNQRVNTVDERFKVDEALLKKALQYIENFDPRITELEKKAHVHHNIDEEGVDQGDNLAVLNRMSEQYNTLYYRGRPISGNSYIYDNVHDAKIWWKDPTDTSATEVEALNSAEIAEKFSQTALARIGMTLFVLEIDGSVSVFKIYRKRRLRDTVELKSLTVESLSEHDDYYKVGSSGIPTSVTYSDACTALEAGEYGDYTWYVTRYTETRAPKFAQTAVEINEGLAEYVEMLPTASQYYAGRGCWVPLKNDGLHIVNHLHKCVLNTNIRNVEDYEAFVSDEPDDTVAYMVREDNVDLSTLTKSDYGSVVYYEGSNVGITSALSTSGVYVNMSVHPTTRDKRDGKVFRMVFVNDLVLDKLRTCGVKATLFRITTKTSETLNKYIVDGAFTDGVNTTILINDQRFTEGWTWKDISNTNQQLRTVGSTFNVCWADNLGNIFNDINLSWKDPEDAVEDGLPVVWAQTKVVRKFGSEPENENDGEVVKVSTTKDEYSDKAYVSVCPYSDKDIYFRLFSRTVVDGLYKASDSWKATTIDWATLKAALVAGYAPAMFEIGSTVILPNHNRFGDIECEVVAVNKDAGGAERNGILLAAKHVVCNRSFDAFEPCLYAKTLDTARVFGKEYYSVAYNTSTKKYTVTKVISKYGSYTDPSVNPKSKGFYELNDEYIGDRTGTSFSYLPEANRVGSNGQLVFSVDGTKTIGHRLNSLNVINWLNSTTAANWWTESTRPTVFDMAEWPGEAGFLAGFEDSSIFSNLFSVDEIALKDGSTSTEYPYSTFIKNCKVILPHSELTGYDVIIKNPVKTKAGSTEGVQWGTLDAVQTASITSVSSYKDVRPHYGFKCRYVTGYEMNLTPDQNVGLIPMFFIGADA